MRIIGWGILQAKVVHETNTKSIKYCFIFMGLPSLKLINSNKSTRSFHKIMFIFRFYMAHFNIMIDVISSTPFRPIKILYGVVQLYFDI